MVSESIQTALAPKPTSAISALRGLMTAQGGLTHLELDEVGAELATHARTTLTEVVDALDLPPGVSTGGIQWGSSPEPPPSGFRVMRSDPGGAGINFSSPPPAEASNGVGLQVVVSTSLDEAETFRLLTRSETMDIHEMLTLGLNEVSQVLSVSAQYRIRVFSERLIANALHGFVDVARSSLASAGYHIDDDQRNV